MSLLQSHFNDSNLLTLQASMSKDKLGVIRDVSPQINELLGWPLKDVIGKNVSIIMPSFMRESHQQVLQSHLERIQDISNSTRLDTVLDSFVISKDGFVVPCEMYLSIHPYILEELVYIVVMKIREQKDGLILLSEDGYIEGLNHKIGATLKLNKGKKTHMREICRDYNPSN